MNKKEKHYVDRLESEVDRLQSKLESANETVEYLQGIGGLGMKLVIISEKIIGNLESYKNTPEMTVRKFLCNYSLDISDLKNHTGDCDTLFSQYLKKMKEYDEKV